MANAGLAPYPRYRSMLADGVTPNAGGKVYTYEAGTSTPKGTQVSRTGSANTNPVILDSIGEADIWYLAGQYKVVEKTSADAPLRTTDEVSSAGDLPSLWTESGSDVYRSSGSVFIGATTGGETLTVVGTGSVSGALTLNNAQTSPWKISTGSGNTALGIQAQGSGVSQFVELFSKDGDGTDGIGIDMYWKGSPGAITNSEIFRMRWNTVRSVFLIDTASLGTGTLRPLEIETNGNTSQLVLYTDGNVGIGDAIPTFKLDVNGTFRAVGAVTMGSTLAVTGVVTLTAQPIISTLTASQAVFSDSSKGLVSNAITGTGNVVMSASPTLTGTITAAAADFSGDVSIRTNTFKVGALEVVVNDAGSIAPDFRVETSNQSNALLVDSSSDSVKLFFDGGSGQTALFTSTTSHFNGTVTMSSTLAVTGNVSTSSGTIIASGNIGSSGGDLALTGNGKGIAMDGASANGKMGSSLLVGGTITVANTGITSNSRIFLTRSVTGGTEGTLSYTTINSTSFTINSSSGTDTSRINWLIIENNG